MGSHDSVQIIRYTPSKKETPKNLVDVITAWRPNEQIIKAVIEDFGIATDLALEFGVDFGFSASALSSYFTQTIGVDIFAGDVNGGNREAGMFETVGARLKDLPIKLIKSDYRDFIRDNDQHYNLIHVDVGVIVHSYEDTFTCGLWSVEHSDVAIFHDTQSFPDVLRAVKDIARKTGKTFYNYAESYGLGIVTNKSLRSIGSY